MRNLIIAFLVSLSLLSVLPAHAASNADVTQNRVFLKFPETATFQITVNSDVEIKSIVLEYGNQQQTCGEVIAKAFPQFTPSKNVQTEWTWDLRQSGSLPPGAQLWWRWRLTDANGAETVTDTQTVTWLDSVHPWQTLSNGQLKLHYYRISKPFAQEMLDAGQEGMDRNKNDAGLTTDSQANIYIYPNYNDLRDAILYEPSWVGGQAYPEENIVILGTSGSDAQWDKNTVIHELTHVLVGHFTFSCLGGVPQWLNEGLAVYSEGPLDPQFQKPLDQAIEADNLLSVRSISGSFSEVADRADLSYAESYSLVNFLIKTYGQDKMTALLAAFRDGATTDQALTQAYGFNIDGLEDQWRTSLGAQPRTASGQPTAQPTPTFVPTIIPVGGGVVAVQQATATPIPTSSFNGNGQPTQVISSPTRTGPPLALTLILLAICCFFILLFGVLILGIVVRNQNRKGGNNVK
jgi:hypothetical protein